MIQFHKADYQMSYFQLHQKVTEFYIYIYIYIVISQMMNHLRHEEFFLVTFLIYD